MQERFTNLFRLHENLYAAGSPLLIAAGALLKDNQTDRVLAQLKLKNISNKNIKAIKVAIDAFDVSGKPVEGVAEYQYLDLNEKRDAEFGQKSAIFLPGNTVRSFAPQITGVFFTDNTSWFPLDGAVWEPLPAQHKLEEYIKDNELAKQYRLETKSSSQFAPFETAGMWLCACGAVNNADEAKCHECGSELSVLKEKLVDTSLAERKDARLEKEREEAKKSAAEKAEQEEKARQEREIKRKKSRMIAATLIPAAVVIIAFVITLTSVIIPNGKYNDAIALMEDGQYEAAIAAFAELDGYKDSVQQIDNIHQKQKESKYNEAVILMEAGEYDQAAEAFQVLGDYLDSLTKLQETYYLKAASLILSGEYDQAEDAIMAAKALNNGGNEEAAAKDFSDVPGGYFVECDNEHVTSAYYQRGQQLLSEGDYEGAITAFYRAGDYEEVKYQKALSLLDSKEYSDAYALFSEIAGYKDSSEFLGKFSFVITGWGDGSPRHDTYEYEYDANGNLNKIIRKFSDWTITYELDENQYPIIAHVVISGDASIDDYDINYSFQEDNSGNITAITETYESHNRETGNTQHNTTVYTVMDGLIVSLKHSYSNSIHVANMSDSSEYEGTYTYIPNEISSMISSVEKRIVTPFEQLDSFNYVYETHYDDYTINSVDIPFFAIYFAF